MNREAWLTEVALQVAPLYNKFHLSKKPYRITMGWPCRAGTSVRRRRIGECHHSTSSSGGFCEIFISPVLDTPLKVAGTVCHELAHVAAGADAGHGSWFTKVCKHVGLTHGKPTEVMPGASLNKRLEGIITKLPEYPHKAITPVAKVRDMVQSSISLVCTSCGCKVRIAIQWLYRAGPPVCGCGGAMVDTKSNKE